MWLIWTLILGILSSAIVMICLEWNKTAKKREEDEAKRKVTNLYNLCFYEPSHAEDLEEVGSVLRLWLWGELINSLSDDALHAVGLEIPTHDHRLMKKATFIRDRLTLEEIAFNPDRVERIMSLTKNTIHPLGAVADGPRPS